MFRRNLVVAFKPIKTNAIILPDSYFRQVQSYENGCIALNYGREVHCIAWAPYGSCITETELGINATVAKAAGLKEGTLVKCSLVADVTVLDSVHVSALSKKDWDMLEVSSYRIQSTILDQTRIVNNGQHLVIWINKAMTITVKIHRLNPNTTHGRLVNNTEVYVAPFSATNLTNGSTDHINGAPKINPKQSTPPIKKSPTPELKKTLSSDVIIEKAAREYTDLITSIKAISPQLYWFRVISSKWEDSPMCNLYLTKHNLPETMDVNEIYALATQDGREYFVNVRILNEKEIFPKNCYPSVEMNDILLDYLNVMPFEKISLRAQSIVSNSIERIELAPNQSIDNKTMKDIEFQFKEYILENTRLYPVLINQQQVLKLKDHRVTAFIYPETLKYCLVDSELLRRCRIKCIDKVSEIRFIDEQKIKNECNKQEEKDKNEIFYVKLDKYEETIDKLIEEFKMFLCLNDKNEQLMTHNVLLIGNTNGGRTTMCQKILSRLAEKPFYCHTEIFNCVKHKGRKAESIQKDLRESFQKCLAHYPSVMVLDNLDILTPIVTEQTQDSMYFNKVSHVIAELITEYTKDNPIAVIGVVTSKQNLNKYIYQPHGWHLFQSILTVPNLNKTDREKIICNICSSHKLKSPNSGRIANLTEGYQIGDLVQFMERAIYYAHRDNPNNPVLTNANLGESLSKTSAYCMEGIEHNTENMKIDDELNDTNHEVTGMGDVIGQLEEIIMWPMKYPEIFDNAPIRIPSAVLLYGPPGTGKTHLMTKLAKLWHLRMITVKGPELLAKYIGQSEENVRNVFKRARAARPCILFFDEFDSLAPRRGHDSTGVTDRVVNQMLTELDGIEEQKGVILVAATCRPELIDPALLRPGRIDRHVECTIPVVSDRLAIFKSLAKSLNLDDTVKLEVFADKTENFTGADIQSILTTANMVAVKDCIAKYKENVPDKIFITQNHLNVAFNETRPSLSKQDLAKYRLMYSRFSKKERGETMAQKVSLA